MKIKKLNRDLCEENHPHWKGDDATVACKRRRTRRWYDLTDCEKCGKPGKDMHHIDEDPGNNEPENIMILCVKCHCHIHGKHIYLAEYSRNREPKPPTLCINCGELHKPTRKGKCSLCYNYFRIEGKERPNDLWHKKPKVLKCKNGKYPISELEPGQPVTGQ